MGADVAPAVSVVIPTRGRPDLLERCLQALADQTLSPDEFEVVVVDDGPSRDTRDAVTRMARSTDLRLRYVTASGRGPAAARNAGWHSARASVIAFTDDDTVPDTAWLEAGVTAIRDGADAVAGRLIMPLPETPTDYERDAAALAEAEFVTANAFCRTDALRAVGGFDERFPLAWREDADLQFSLVEQGFTVGVAPEAVVVHPVRPARWGVSMHQQAKTEYNALLRRKHPRLYRERLSRSPRWYYAAVGSAMAAVAAFAIGRPRRALGLAMSWLLMTGWFVGKRLSGTSKRPSHVLEMVVTSAAIPFLSVFRRLRGALRFRTLLP
jgi:GT2 family glycosyltransferase